MLENYRQNHGTPMNFTSPLQYLENSHQEHGKTNKVAVQLSKTPTVKPKKSRQNRGKKLQRKKTHSGSLNSKAEGGRENFR